MEQITKFYPAWDRTDPDPKKNYGIHCVDLLMLLKGELGAVQFKMLTQWYPKGVNNRIVKETLRDHMDPFSEPGISFERTIELHLSPMPSDIGYHSPKPMYDDQKGMGDSCEWLDGKPCYYDGSSLEAENVYDILLKEGSDGVWKYLEEYYINVFGELK